MKNESIKARRASILYDNWSPARRSVRSRTVNSISRKFYSDSSQLISLTVINPWKCYF